MKPNFSVCVYCGSRPGNDPVYAEAARATGQWIGEHGGQLVYGGGRNGLMGIVAEATQAAGGRVVGIIPKALVDLEQANTHCDELHVVDTMHERKALMADRSDAFIALPGGIGTFEELFEVWTWRQLRYHDKAIGVLNVAGYYDALLVFLANSVRAGFMSEAQMTLFKTDTAVEPLMRAVVQAAGVQKVPNTLEDKL
ncbi:MAG: TIGR00730 family Rossman fold protein [Xylophilus sp.]|nr:TIGR00730 family Rossman fold protein [Xylophilus sp.]MBP6618311.1 TIGR00730 family Rossman fold protein [Burkholderiaceae bacterium]MBP7419888.1 TIGR00730 family Rossman fold protein [Burkholderiaceae bacterium]